MKKRQIQAICFDFWGTLVEGGGEGQILDLKRTLKAHEIDHQRFLSQVEESLMTHSWTLEEGIKDLAKKLRIKVDEGVVKKGGKLWMGYAQRNKPFGETEMVLNELKKIKLRMIIVSNTDLWSIQFKVKKLGWEKFFKRLFISAEIGVLKPHPRIFESVEKYLRLPREEILMIDDSLYHGVLPARDFGWQALWLARGKKGSDLGRIEDLREILEFLE